MENGTLKQVREVKGYILKNSRTGIEVKRYAVAQRKAAYRMMDKLDDFYGGYSYTVEILWA